MTTSTYIAVTPTQYDIVTATPFPCNVSEAALMVVTEGGQVEVKAYMKSYRNADTLAYQLNNKN